MRRNFVRKVVYLLLALGIFVVILFVRGPIEQYRTDHQLSTATLGDVDPTSSSMVLVLGGLRGVAANMLWSRALEMQREHDWTNLEAVVKSIVKLEPHFISIWTFQGWNLAYNVSVEWDQVEDKYYWIKEGIKFLRRGTEVNGHSPELRWDVGWTYFHKLGKADEAKLLRQIYRSDDDPEIDASGREHLAFNPDGLDNYQASFTWFEQAVTKCDEPPKKRPRRMGEVAFRSYPSHAQMNYALGREEDGEFGESVRSEFERALQLWTEYADYDYQFTEGKAVHLDYPADIYADLYRAVAMYSRSAEFQRAIADRMEKDKEPKVSEPAPSETETANSETADKLTEWPTFVAECERNLQEFNQPTIDLLPPGAGDALAALRSAFPQIQNADVALLTQAGSPGVAARQGLAEFAAAAEKLGKLADEELYWCDRYASMINFRYWKERALCESQRETAAARQHFYVGQQRFREGDPETAKDELEKGLALWQTVTEKFAYVRNDDLTAEETMKVIETYQRVRQQLDMPELKTHELPFQEYVKKFTPTMPTREELERYMKMMEESGNQPGIERLKMMMQQQMDAIETEAVKKSLQPTPADPAKPDSTSPPPAPDTKKDEAKQSDQPKNE